MHKKGATVLWDFPIQTDRTIKVNRPYITIKDLEEKTCKLLDFTFPLDINISAKQFEKLSNYKNLQMEIERMWQLKTSVIPIVVGALVLVKRGTAKHLKKILGKQNLAEMQKILLTSTEHIKKSVINISYNTKD